MKKAAKKALGFLMVTCLTTGLLSQAALPAYAAEAGTGMQLVSAGGIGDGDHVYFGVKDETNYTWTDDAPYWRVLDADEMNTGDAGMFLLSENLIGNNPGGSYGNIYFNQDDTKGNAWQGSDARNWCGGFLTNVFSAQEQAAIAAATISDPPYTCYDAEYGYSVDFSASDTILNGDRIFFLSAEEADSSEYGFTDNNSRKANYESDQGFWWLRSPYAYSNDFAGLVYHVGRIYELDVDTNNTARPAFNLNLSSVLFTSAAEGGKSSGTEGADSLKEVSAYSGKDWKFTIKDSARSGFKASYDSRSGDLITVNYSGAKAGTNEYISAVIVSSSGEITYYGNLAKAKEGDENTVTVNLTGKYNEEDTLYVFNEQANGDKKTDYSSELQEIEIAAPAAAYTVSFDAGGGSGTMEDETGVSGEYTLPKCLFTAPENKTFDCWLVDGEEYAEGGSIIVDGDTTVTAKWKDVPPAHVHSLKLVEEEEAACTEDGNTAYYVCEECGLWFEDATALVEITDKSSVIIKALGHKWDKGTVTKEPTETEDGIRTYTCLNDSSHTKTESIPKIKPEPEPEHEHSLTKVDAVGATCTEEGNTAYYVCDGCGLWFKDADGKVQITDKSSVVIKALGHKWDNGVVTKEATYTAEGTRTFTCLNDSSHTKTETIPKKERRSSGGDSGSSGSSSSTAVRGARDQDASGWHYRENGTPVKGAWDQDASGWHYRENGTPVKGAWRYLPYSGVSYWYYFDENGVMKTGWLDWNGSRYYLWPVSDGWMGRMVTGWQTIDGKGYFFETEAEKNQGHLYMDTVAPDGTRVGPDGVRVQ